MRFANDLRVKIATGGVAITAGLEYVGGLTLVGYALCGAVIAGGLGMAGWSYREVTAAAAEAAEDARRANLRAAKADSRVKALGERLEAAENALHALLDRPTTGWPATRPSPVPRGSVSDETPSRGRHSA